MSTAIPGGGYSTDTYGNSDLTPGNCWNNDRFAYVNSGANRWGQRASIEGDRSQSGSVPAHIHANRQLFADALVSKANLDLEALAYAWLDAA